ncbi:MAG: hypothetical protein WC956_03940 [bacterium]
MDSRIKEIISKAGDAALARDEAARFELAYAEAAGQPFAWDGAAALAHIFGNSRALAERLVAHPDWADAISRSPYARARKPVDAMRAELEREIAAAAPAGDEGAFMHSLRMFKYREMIRIAARDIAEEAPVKELISEWSDTADLCIDAAYARAHVTLAAKYGPPMIRGTDRPAEECAGCVVALGKLGGRELNMSSDVDLLFLYSSDEGIPRGEGGSRLSNHEFFVKLAELVTKFLALVTPDGFVFRVDHELRPEGPQGALANSLDAAERYYQYFGRDWERQALIRARPVAGDLSLGDAFVQAVRPFVYRRHISISDISHMKEMKEKMEQSAMRRQPSFDVKFSAGGIREAEFLVQAICLLFGGKRPALRVANTFEAIEALSSNGLMHPFGAKTLTEAYAFLRRMENMIQVADEVQTHRLPADEAGLEALARRMGYRDADADAAAQRMHEDLSRHAHSVESLFRAIFKADYERSELMEAIRDNASHASNEEEELESLAWFKNLEVRRIQQHDMAGTMPLRRVLERLTLAAEAVLTCAWEMAVQHMDARYGTPRDAAGAHAGFAIVGMGSLGAGEVDYGSDLDLCFLFSGEGETDGKKRISNVEYFTKLAQRIITTITLPGRYGRAYLVDSELRPSGNAGTLVATLDSFRAYHAREAHLWERRSLLKARVIAGDPQFLDESRSALDSIAFESPIPLIDEIKAEIVALRKRTMDERVRAKEDAINLKIGSGGLADVEAIAQLNQLFYSANRPPLHRQNTFDVLDALHDERLLSDKMHEALVDHLFFFRRVISRARLAGGRGADEVSFSSPFIAALAEQMGCASAEELRAEIERRMNEVRSIFEDQLA